MRRGRLKRVEKVGRLRNTESDVSADQGLPHLRAARDPAMMREIFEEHLNPLSERDYEIYECRVSRVRHQPGTRCLLQYLLRMRDRDSGRRRNQRVTGVVRRPERAQKVWAEVQRSGRPPDGPEVPFGPYAYISELDMLVQVFPYDHRLPGIAVLMGKTPPELVSSMVARFGTGRWRAEACEVEPIQYHPASRATLRLTVRAKELASGRCAARRFYAKVYRDEGSGGQVFRVQRALWDRTGAGFTVPMPVAYLHDLRTVVQEEVSAPSLHEQLLLGTDASAAMSAAARALADMHLSEQALEGHPRDSIAADLGIRTRALRRACPHLEPDLDEISAAILDRLEPFAPAPTHGDLTLRHILFDGERLTLLDLDDFALADPVVDVARALAHLAVMPYRYPVSHDHAQAAGRVFVDEYFAQVPPAWRPRLPSRYAGALVQIAHGFVRDPATGSPEIVEALLAEARESLAGTRW